MKKTSCHTRREFMEGVLFAGAAFAFARLARAQQGGSSSVSFGTPLLAQAIPQPDSGVCTWVGFSPVNDQAAYVSGIAGQASLYVSRAGQPGQFDLLWKSNVELNAIHACAWSPNGQEIAFLVQAVNSEATPKTARVSIFVADVATKAVREPVIISEAIGSETTQLVNVSHKRRNGLAWWNDSSICATAERASGAEILKFDSHTGQAETLIPVQEGISISNIALTRSQELRFVKIKTLESGSQLIVAGLAQNGTTRDIVDLTQQFGAKFNAQLSQDGEFVFIEKHDPPPQTMPMLDPATAIIYKIETQSVISQISLNVYQGRDMFTYMPLAVRNDNELILIEAAMLEVDGGSGRNMRMKAVKKTL
jgi:hypothetical protein